MSTGLINSGDEWAVTPAQSFSSEVDSEIRRLEREGMRAALLESQKRTDETVARLHGELIQAWRNLVEETSLSEALRVIAADVRDLAEEYGRFGIQERHVVANRLCALAERAGRAGL